MASRYAMVRISAIWLAIASASFCAFGLNPRKTLTQYSRTVWTQQDGLPQDTVKAIRQTPDGYLWLGTDEGLVRFDGYDFTRFSRDDGHLPSNSITALATGPDGTLWIGTPNGLARYRDRQFRVYTQRDGLVDDSVTGLYADPKGVVWIVAGGNLSRFDGRQFTSFLRGREIAAVTVRAVTGDGEHIYVAGNNRVTVLREDGKFQTILSPPALRDDFLAVAISVDRSGTVWLLGTRGLVRRARDGSVRQYGPQDGLPDSVGQGALWVDRQGTLWVGTANQIARFEAGRFESRSEIEAGEPDLVRALFEDREGNLWVGSSGGLMRFRDDVFTIYGKAEGLPSDEPTTVFQDSSGRIWVGFAVSGMMVAASREPRTFSPAPQTPKTRIFSIHESRAGELLIAAGNGLTILAGGKAQTFVPAEDPLNRKFVYDALEGEDGRIWVCLPNGLGELRDSKLRMVVPGGPLIEDAVLTLARGPGNSIWAGTRRGLWHVDGLQVQRFTSDNGLGSNQVLSLSPDRDGTLWIGTFGGGLHSLRNGKLLRYTVKDGLLSDNIEKVLDDGESLWLSTTRGICRIAKKQLADFAAKRISGLRPVNYGTADGLPSAQYSPTVGGGGFRHSDGSLWFVTARGIAVFQPQAAKEAAQAPQAPVVELSAGGRPFDPAEKTPRIPPGTGDLQFRYTAFHLSAPDRVEYSYRLEGLDANWVEAGSRRSVDYSNLGKGNYRFHVRAALPGGVPAEEIYVFEVLPHFYETVWFRLLAIGVLGAAVWGIYQLRERRVRSRFALVLEERARLAREVHDTMAQGFVGISSQLDAVAMCLEEESGQAKESLDLARRMARHSLTEARRSVMDLRAAALEDQDLGAALESGAHLWTAGSGVDVEVEVAGETNSLPEHIAHHVLRIAQEAVTNVLKHARASKIGLRLQRESKALNLSVVDNGCGFEGDGVFLSASGHYGIMGMRERAERVGGEMRLDSKPGEGTRLDITVPLP